MLIYDIDDVITEMMEHEETILSAEACNSINFCRSNHPCCAGKSDLERIQQVSMAIVGRNVHPVFRERLERLADKAIRAEQEA